MKRQIDYSGCDFFSIKNKQDLLEKFYLSPSNQQILFHLDLKEIVNLFDSQVHSFVMSKKDGSSGKRIYFLNKEMNFPNQNPFFQIQKQIYKTLSR